MYLQITIDKHNIEDLNNFIVNNFLFYNEQTVVVSGMHLQFPVILSVYKLELVITLNESLICDVLPSYCVNVMFYE